MLYKYQNKDIAERVIAAILDNECYESTDKFIKQLADIYFKHSAGL